MNRRILLQRVSAAALGVMVWIVPHKVDTEDVIQETGCLQLWLGNQFYINLPKDRYTDSVDVDWVMAKEWKDGPWEGRFVAQCRVRPNPSMNWELFVMERV